jgi:hypothetical protein
MQPESWDYGPQTRSRKGVQALRNGARAVASANTEFGVPRCARHRDCGYLNPWVHSFQLRWRAFK